jgi:hypothetical protein
MVACVAWSQVFSDNDCIKISIIIYLFSMIVRYIEDESSREYQETIEQLLHDLTIILVKVKNVLIVWQLRPTIIFVKVKEHVTCD